MLPKITRRRVLSAVAVVAVAGGGSGYWLSQRGSGTSAAATPTTSTQTVSTGTIQQSVSASGTLSPAEDESLNFSSAGVVTSVRVAEGQKVKKGQKLATIDSASLAATVAQNRATVAEDKSRVSDDEDNAASDAQLAADKAALKAARNQLASAKAALAGATLTSPIDGVVAAVNLTVGQSVSGSGSGSGSSASGLGGSSSSSTSSAQIEVISTDSWIVDSTVDASSVDLIKVGNQAQLSITGYSGGTVYGTISSIAVLSSSSSGTASYPVVIAVTGSKSGLHDGQDVTATLIYKQLSNVIVVPTVALHRNSSGGEYVEKVVDGKPVQTTVQVGISSGTQTQITSGLTAGDKIQVQQFTVRRTGGTSGQPTGTTRGNFGGGNFPGGGNFGGGNFPGGGFGG
jgi:multidrug efflux pump subunit AcrA (membrane-fusion protein)